MLHVERGGHLLDEPEFDILFESEAIASNPDRGTVAGGNAISPWDDLPIDGDYIKSEAKADRMGSILYAVAIRLPGSGRQRSIRTFRAPTVSDMAGLSAAEAELAKALPDWLVQGIIPTEERYIGPADRSANYGIKLHRDLFSPRQLLVHGMFVEEFHRLIPEVEEALPPERAEAVLGVLAMMQGKSLNYNALLSSWDATRDRIRSVFDTHSFAFKWTYGEFEGARVLYPWCLDQVADAYEEISRLMRPSDSGIKSEASIGMTIPGEVTVTRGNAGDLVAVSSKSQSLVCIDPPYFDNVMYGELSDFFGVWEQRTVGKIWPELMPGGLADLKNEAVANVARFADAGRRKNQLAEADYEAKMQGIFAECHRVLADDGVMTVMFTHKKATAWDALGMALMEAGFTIETSWPIKTESEQSLHQAKKNAAESTIMMVCRKRADDGEGTPYFEDLEAEVRRAAKDAVARFAASGISGVDLLLSTYGPALSVISAHWPVYSSEADEFRQIPAASPRRSS